MQFYNDGDRGLHAYPLLMTVKDFDSIFWVYAIWVIRANLGALAACVPYGTTQQVQGDLLSAAGKLCPPWRTVP